MTEKRMKAKDVTPGTPIEGENGEVYGVVSVKLGVLITVVKPDGSTSFRIFNPEEEVVIPSKEKIKEALANIQRTN